MKRSLAIVLVGLALACSSYGVLIGFRAATLHQVEQTSGPELAWIKTEFNLDPTTLDRVRTLHEAYKSKCADLCHQIDAQHQQLAKLLATAETVTPEMAQLVTTANTIRSQCQTEMLHHFFEVSRAMPPEQGRRYLAWMHDQTLAPSHASMLPRLSHTTSHDQHVH